jgi:hypothetical protein
MYDQAKSNNICFKKNTSTKPVFIQDIEILNVFQSAEEEIIIPYNNKNMRSCARFLSLYLLSHLRFPHLDNN